MTVSNEIDPVAAGVLAFVAGLINGELGPDDDLFATGGLSSLKSLELVVHVEREYGVAVTGDDMSLDNFRTAAAISRLVRRLQ